MDFNLYQQNCHREFILESKFNEILDFVRHFACRVHLFHRVILWVCIIFAIFYSLNEYLGRKHSHIHLQNNMYLIQLRTKCSF